MKPEFLPSVDSVLRRPAVMAASERHGRSVLAIAVREVLESHRRSIDGAGEKQPGDRAEIARRIEVDVLEHVARAVEPSIRRVFNLSGTVIHTNLGRAPLAVEAIDAVVASAGEASNLEYDLIAGTRGERDDHVTDSLRRLSKAEAALVVNNNAAAVLLALNSLANRREVIISRGEQIEIGGAFRMPDVMTRAGCRLREVGTTNRTHLSDYADAIGPRTAAILKVHPSNYAVSGFTATVDESELARLAHERGLPLIVDLGSGSLIDLEAFGLPREPTVASIVERGADLVTFSGDKLLGGPQAGLIVGQAKLVEKLRRNPLRRALRVDKMTLAALAATLRLHFDEGLLVARLPALRQLTRPTDKIRVMAETLAPLVTAQIRDRASVSIEPCLSQIGSGSLPIDRLASWALVVRPRGTSRKIGLQLGAWALAFRMLPVPVIGRIAKGALVLDLRCLEDAEAFVGQLHQLVPPVDP